MSPPPPAALPVFPPAFPPCLAHPRRATGRILVLGFAASFLLSGCERAVERYCALRLAPAHYNVTVDELTPRTQQRYSASELDHLDEHPSNETTLGLTSAKSRSEAHITLHAVGAPGGGVCVRPDVSLALGYAGLRVDLARELRPNTCTYNQVLAHEMRHVGVYRSFLGEARTTLEAALEERLPRSRVYRFSSMTEAGAYFEKLQDEWLSPASLEVLDGVAARQAEVDTPEEYQRLSGACPSDELKLR